MKVEKDSLWYKFRWRLAVYDKPENTALRRALPTSDKCFQIVHHVFLARFYEEMANKEFASKYGHLFKLGDNINAADVPDTFPQFLKALEGRQGDAPTQRLLERLAAVKTAVTQGNRSAETKQQLLKWISEWSSDSDVNQVPEPSIKFRNL
mgnify:CR=1 FL=1